MTTTTATETIASIEAARIVPGNNDRKVFAHDGLVELAESIAQHGLAQRPTVRPLADGRFEIVAGERRFRAMTEILGWLEVPVVVRQLDDRAASAIMLAENLSRADLDLIAEATAYQARIDEFGLTVGEVAAWAGVSVARVTVRLPLLQLVDEAQQLVASGNLSTNHARSMSDLDANRQRIALRALAAGNLSYFEFADLCQRLRNEQAAEGMDLFTMTVDEYVVDAKGGRAAKAASKNALLARAAKALAGVDDDLAAEIIAALA